MRPLTTSTPGSALSNTVGAVGFRPTDGRPKGTRATGGVVPVLRTNSGDSEKPIMTVPRLAVRAASTEIQWARPVVSGARSKTLR